MKKDGKEKEEMKEVAAIYREMANIIEEMAENEDEKKRRRDNGTTYTKNYKITDDTTEDLSTLPPVKKNEKTPAAT